MANKETFSTDQEQGPVSAPAMRATFIFIVVTVALDFLAFGIIAPVLPNLIKQFEGGNMARASEITGYFAFAWATMQFFFSPVLGAWSDRFGRRPVILISCLGLGLDYIFMALAPTLWWLFVGRIISGITTSNISTAFAYIADVTPAEDRAKRYGMLGAAFGLGFVIGPAAGGLLGHYSLRAPFWAAAGLSLANFLYGLFVLPESLPVQKRAKSAWHMANPLGSLTLLRSNVELSWLAVVTTINYLAHQSLPAVFVLYSEYRYGWTERGVGLALAMVGICAAVVSGGMVGPYVKRFGERSSLLSGLLFGILGFVGMAFAPKSWAMFLAIPFIALWGVANPAMQSLMSQHVDPSSQGKLQGAINSLRALTGMVGPLIFTQVFAVAISAKALRAPGAPYYLAGLMLGAALLLAAMVTNSNRLVSAQKA
ncbi:MAG TPA: TCR/Tet family MFS transporter [Candidatus Acidoferrum sp.]|nr:TCR/Tet family MFS transporter [Candidatus Acidoferrum sp.]